MLITSGSSTQKLVGQLLLKSSVMMLGSLRIAHIKTLGRSCKQLRVAGTSSGTQTLMKNLSSIPKAKRPQKVASLRNHIAAQLKLKGNEVAIQNALNQLVTQKFLQISDSGLEYLA